MAGLREYSTLVLTDGPSECKSPSHISLTQGISPFLLLLSFFGIWGRALRISADAWLMCQTDAIRILYKRMHMCALKVSLRVCVLLECSISSSLRLVLKSERLITQGKAYCIKAFLKYSSRHSWCLIHEAGSPPVIRHHLFARVLTLFDTRSMPTDLPGGFCLYYTYIYLISWHTMCPMMWIRKQHFNKILF